MIAPQPTPGSQASLREANRRRLVEAVQKYGGLTQVELAGATGLSPATVHNIVRELSETAVLATSHTKRSGRRAVFVTLARQSGLISGVHISARHLRVSLVDGAFSQVARQHMPLAPSHRADNELGRIAEMITDMLDSVDAEAHELKAIGVAVSAPINRRNLSVSREGIMPGWDHVPIADQLGRFIKVPIIVDNDANMSALAEFQFGSARGHPNSIYINVSHGIGAGIMIDGNLVRGHMGGAGELGHTILDEDGPLCRCGNHGCLDVIAGGNALVSQLQEDARPVKLSDVVTRTLEGEDRYVRAVADAGRNIGAATADMCNLLDPERIIVGGELAAVGETLLSPLRHRLERTQLVDGDTTPEVVSGKLGDRAATLGAAALAASRLAGG